MILGLQKDRNERHSITRENQRERKKLERKWNRKKRKRKEFKRKKKIIKEKYKRLWTNVKKLLDYWSTVDDKCLWVDQRKLKKRNLQTNSGNQKDKKNKVLETKERELWKEKTKRFKDDSISERPS